MKPTLAITLLAGAFRAPGCRGRMNNPAGPGWEKLGTRMVNFHADHDVIGALLQGTFRRIRIDVDRADLEMYDVKINFLNGESYSPAIRHHFTEGSWSRQIDLPGASRVIKSIEFRYKTSHRGEGRANVDVFGLH